MNVPDPVDEDMPEWKRQSVERSLKAARARARDRSDRFVAAAIQLMGERGGIEFTVQDVVDRSRMSIRTFYNFFASKDDLLVAVHETVLAREVTERLRRRCATEADPVRRVGTYIEGMYELTAQPTPISRLLTIYRNRLAETRPAAVEQAFRPQIDLVVELVRDAAVAQGPPGPLDPDVAAHLLHHTVLAAVHARVLAADPAAGATAEELWAFCASGMGVQAAAEEPG